MKKIACIVIAIFLSVTFYPGQSIATTENQKGDITSVEISNPDDQAKVEMLELRLSEINEMDKSNLNWAERRELRKEVRSIKKQLNELGNGVYISVGAIIIIILLLVILL
jgi:GTP-dependent phosphoenolpyruvate carboxykinase